jgi:hypothetical protein
LRSPTGSCASISTRSEKEDAPRFEGPARRRAIVALDHALELFAAERYEREGRREPLRARVAAPDGPPLRLELVREGRIFGGTYGLEVSSAKPLLPPTRGVTARGRGVVRLRGIDFRPRRGDRAGQELAARLAADDELVARLSAVHFERIRIEPDGRPVIRHLGGSLVWIAFPPIVKEIPLVPEQVRATVAALAAFGR